MESRSQAQKAISLLVGACIAVILLDMVVVAGSQAAASQHFWLSAAGLIILNILFLAVLAKFLYGRFLQPLVSDLNEMRTRLGKIAASLHLAERANADLTCGALFDQISEQILETRKREQAILEKAVDVICVIGVDSRFISLSPSVERAWGYSPEELIGKPLSEITVSPDQGRTLESALGAQQSIDRISFDNSLRKKDGKLIDLSWSAHWSAHGDGLFCVAHDITERKKAELKLLESEQRLRETLEAMPVGVASLHSSGKVEFANACLRKFSGRSDDELLGFPLSDLFAAGEKAILDPYLRKVASASEVDASRFELNLQSKMPRLQESHEQTGQSVALPVEVSATKFVMQGTTRLLVTLADITHRKQIEKLRREFVSMVNHDLRAPLNSLAGLILFLTTGSYGDLTEQGIELCKLAQLELERLLRLVNDLLDLDRLESGKLTVEPQLVSVEDLLEASVSAVRTHADLRGVQLAFAESESACWADRARIIQVLVNLISNAIKFSEPGSKIQITVEEAPDSTKFSVIDQGRGMSEEEAAQLFQRFAQLRPGDPAELAGSGLGLSICKAIVQAHDGQIGCKGNEKAGCTFWFTLPSPPQFD